MQAPTPPPKSIRRAAGRAIADYRMIASGDRILLGLSGGKDSLTLLHVLLYLQRHAPVAFDIASVTIDPLTTGFDPSPLTAYARSLSVPHWHIREPIVELAQQHMSNDSYCAFCARMRRGLIYRTAREHGYNVVALGQHLDDLAESFLMSVLRGGRLQTMKAHYRIEAGDLRLIRPLVYLRERQARDFAQTAGLPIIQDNCPACFRAPSERDRMKQLLTAEEQANPRVFKSLLAAMQPLMAAGELDADSPAKCSR